MKHLGRTAPVAALCKGVKVPASPFLNETRIRRMEEGRYEGDEIAGALAVVREGDRVLELGAGLGIVGAVVARNARPEAVLSFEANPNLLPYIQALYKINGLEDVMEVRNAVVLASEARPEAVAFHLRNSFLGSSLTDTGKRETTPIEVPTAGWADLVRGFRPDVLILDIEGAELDLLRDGDLTGIRAIVIEFHPDLYGKPGTSACKDALRAAGFRKRDAVSTRFVWTCEREDLNAQPPHPSGGWSEEIVEVERPVVVPPAKRSHVQVTGVLDANGHPVSHAGHWQKERLMTHPPAMPRATERLPGRWLWGGVLWRYFPHYITESITRLWALDRIDAAGLDGILYVPKNPKRDEALPGFHMAFLRCMGCSLPMHIARAPVQADVLVVPGQGFGLGEISRGTEAFRRAISNRFGRGIEPEGPERLYVSRSKLGANRGALLGEPILERLLEAEGYAVFHPQEHPLDVQIARYRAARKVIAVEGSALHFYAYAAGRDADVAMILRRRSVSTGFISTHVESFTGRAPLWIDTLRRRWRSKESARSRLAIGEPDFAEMQKQLIAGGFIAGGPAWPQPLEAEMQALLGPNYRLD
ncbi:FkbM family methyltransferase [Sagittula sp. M10.9X]|uniref:FkbM family methyltransferase n=2 Tax=Sagittula salina TaxID=2820268 RepID=A0A940MQN6_9RHOB|nr:FkbM family methyltransferase [Sagittula salina]